MPVQFSTRQVEPSITVLGLAGRLTLGNRLAEIEHAIKNLIEKGARKVVLDLTQLTFLDSAGIGMVMLCAGLSKEAGGRLLIVGADGHVRRVLELTHVHEVVPMFSDLAQSFAEFDTPESMPQA